MAARLTLELGADFVVFLLLSPPTAGVGLGVEILSKSSGPCDGKRDGKAKSKAERPAVDDDDERARWSVVRPRRGKDREGGEGGVWKLVTRADLLKELEEDWKGRSPRCWAGDERSDVVCRRRDPDPPRLFASIPRGVSLATLSLRGLAYESSSSSSSSSSSECHDRTDADRAPLLVAPDENPDFVLARSDCFSIASAARWGGEVGIERLCPLMWVRVVVVVVVVRELVVRR